MEIKIDNKTLIRILIVTTLFVLVAYMLYVVRGQLVWLGISFFLALALEPSVKKLSRYMPKKSRVAALLIVFTLLIAALAFVVVQLGPPLIKESTQLIEDAPSYYQKTLELDNPVSDYLRSTDLTANLFEEERISQLFSYSDEAISIVGSIFGSFIAIITILVLTFYMVLDGPKMVAKFWSYQPADKLEHRKELANKMYRSVVDYVNGSIFKGVLAGVITSIFLLIIGAPFIIALGIIMAILSLIPLIGATIAAVFITLIVLIFVGGTKAFIAIVFFVIYQQVENNLIQPLLFSKSINISPLVVAIAGLLGAFTAGLIGALVAIPVAASLQILVKDYLDNRNLEVK
jgi:predicted PurR-regulated permease PerM